MTFLGYKPSTLLLWVVLSLPALTMIGPLLGDDARAFHRLLHPTGEWAARFMIIGMMASGLMLVFRGRQWPRWLMHHRRDIEVAALGGLWLTRRFLLPHLKMVDGNNDAVSGTVQAIGVELVGDDADADREVVAHPGADRAQHLAREARPALEIAAVCVVAGVVERRQELVQQVAVRHVHLDAIEATLAGERRRRRPAS